MFNEFDVVKVTVPLDEVGIAAGTIGTIVDLPSPGSLYLVEFADDKGATIALVDLTAEQLQLVTRFEAPDGL